MNKKSKKEEKAGYFKIWKIEERIKRGEQGDKRVGKMEIKGEWKKQKERGKNKKIKK